VEMRNLPKQKIVRSTLDAIAKHGFYLTHAAIQAELLGFSAQNDAKRLNHDSRQNICSAAAPTKPSSGIL
jgi:hypothetical protein